MFIVELLVVLVALALGARLGGSFWVLQAVWA